MRSKKENSVHNSDGKRFFCSTSFCKTALNVFPISVTFLVIASVTLSCLAFSQNWITVTDDSGETLVMNINLLSDSDPVPDKSFFYRWKTSINAVKKQYRQTFGMHNLCSACSASGVIYFLLLKWVPCKNPIRRIEQIKGLTLCLSASFFLKLVSWLVFFGGDGIQPQASEFMRMESGIWMALAAFAADIVAAVISINSPERENKVLVLESPAIFFPTILNPRGEPSIPFLVVVNDKFELDRIRKPDILSYLKKQGYAELHLFLRPTAERKILYTADGRLAAYSGDLSVVGLEGSSENGDMSEDEKSEWQSLMSVNGTEDVSYGAISGGHGNYEGKHLGASSSSSLNIRQAKSSHTEV
jgi:hypothetical protein